MAFWSGQTLAQKLPQIITSGFDPAKIDCAAYTLTMGSQFFVTPGKPKFDPFSDVIKDLTEGKSFKIPSGQFAFLLTEEKIKVPADVLAFISMKSTYKWKGLVNVSGFHVDPGYEGRLIFAVYNAGPKDIHLKRGELLFLIWFADLDQHSWEKYAKSYNDKNTPLEAIPSSLTAAVAGHIYSPMTLIEETRANRESLSRLYWIGFIAIGVITIVAGLVWYFIEPEIEALRRLPHMESRLKEIEARPVKSEQTATKPPIQQPETKQRAAPSPSKEGR